MFKNFREKLARQYILKHHAVSDLKSASLDFKNIKTIFILYEIIDNNTCKDVDKIVAELSEQGKKVNVLAYFNKKNIPVYFNQRILQNIITRKNLNWRYMPIKNEHVKSISSTTYDLLIDLTLQENLPLLYCAAVSKASVKVGRFEDKNKPYFNLMLYPSKNENIYNFGKQILYYLNKITS